MTTIAPGGVPVAGDLAPDFTLRSTADTPVTLSSLRGQKHVLLAFFPFAFSRVCTEEFCEMRDHWDAFARHDLEVFPISVDSPHALREFKAKHGMQVTLLSDFHREVSAAYGTLFGDAGFSNRGYVLIDKEGVIRWRFVEETPGTRREHTELLAEIAKLA
ncbi:MAG: redoxin domain-containing protein [Gemmatimonadetes bacterium]|nr:redoxin domain-containing protein [Gemmatimonadota bacterium]